MVFPSYPLILVPQCVIKNFPSRASTSLEMAVHAHHTSLTRTRRVRCHHLQSNTSRSCAFPKYRHPIGVSTKGGNILLYKLHSQRLVHETHVTRDDVITGIGKSYTNAIHVQIFYLASVTAFQDDNVLQPDLKWLSTFECSIFPVVIISEVTNPVLYYTVFSLENMIITKGNACFFSGKQTACTRQYIMNTQPWYQALNSMSHKARKWECKKWKSLRCGIIVPAAAHAPKPEHSIVSSDVTAQRENSWNLYRLLHSFVAH